MLKEFIQSIRDLALEAERPFILKDPELPHDATLVAFKGKLEKIARVRPDRTEKLEDVGSFAKCVADFGAADLKRTVFVGIEEAVCVYGDDRFDRTRLPLKVTDRWRALLDLYARDFTPKEAVQFLRFVLHAAGADSMITALRVLNFEELKRVGSTVQHGRESLGRSIEAKVEQADRVPEQFRASVQVFRNAGLREIIAQVDVAVYLDVEKQRVRLVPLADAITSAFDTALWEAARKIEDVLEEAEVVAPVVMGEPD